MQAVQENDVVVQLNDVTKVINGRTIIKDLTFSVRRGEIYGFLGPNGAGKTTTIRMMVGLISMTKGDIVIEGHNIRTNRAAAMAKVGAIVENPELYGYMSGMKNMLHFARMSAEPIAQSRIDEMVELVELKHAIKDKVKTYSLGMKQRLGIAQALLHKPSILILDEPTNGLDPAGIRSLRDYLRGLAKKENIAIIVSSHLLSEVELLCDRVLIIQNGQLVNELPISGNSLEHHSKAPVEFDVSDVPAALKLLTSMNPIEMNGKVIVEMERDTIPTVIEILMSNKVLIYGVHAKNQSLEETFLALTKGETEA